MPINLGALPGLFDFSLGRSSAIAQQNALLQNDQQRTSNFIGQLNALNAGLSTNDNLEFRRGFAEQPAGTSILDRFNNFSAATTNPFALQQSAVQAASLAPILATQGVQSPAFATSQGLPQTFQGALGQGLFGANPVFQQQANAQIQGLVAQNNPGLDANTRAATLLSAFQRDQTNQSQQDLNSEVADLRRQIAALTQGGTTAVRSGTPANSVNTAAQSATSIASPLPSGLSGVPANASRAGL